MANPRISPDFPEDYQIIFLKCLDEQEADLRKLAEDACEKFQLRMTTARMLQFVIMLICGGVLGLVPFATYHLFISASVARIHEYIAGKTPAGFPGESTFYQRAYQLQTQYSSQILEIIKVFIDNYETRVGKIMRDEFREILTTVKSTATPNASCFLGVKPPRELLRTVPPAEWGKILPFVHARLYMLAHRVTSIKEMISLLNTPKIEGKQLRFPLAGELGFVTGPPGMMMVYRMFRRVNDLIATWNTTWNEELCKEGLMDLTAVSFDSTPVKTDKKDKTGTQGTGSRGSYNGHKATIAGDANCIPIVLDLADGACADTTLVADPIIETHALARSVHQDIWVDLLDAGYSNDAVIDQVEALESIPIVDLNPRNSTLLNDLKAAGTDLAEKSKQAYDLLTEEEKGLWKRVTKKISANRGSPVPLLEKKSFSGKFSIASRLRLGTASPLLNNWKRNIGDNEL